MTTSTALPRLPFTLLNAFAFPGKPHSGNQASVVLLPSSSDPRGTDEEYMSALARDFNLAETAFLVPVDGEEATWGLRWFTTEVEVPLCGHATLAASHVVFSNHPDLSQATLQTLYSGDLIVRRDRAGAQGEGMDITISLPTLSPDKLSILESSASDILPKIKGPLSKALGQGIDPAGADILNAGEFKFDEKSLMVEIREEVDLGALKPDLKELASISAGMLIITQVKHSESSLGRLRINSRVYWGGQDFDEDPVTGSAHAYLTGYYLLTARSSSIPRAIIADGTPKDVILDARQLSRRGGHLVCSLSKTHDGKVDMKGTCYEMAKGELSVW